MVSNSKQRQILYGKRKTVAHFGVVRDYFITLEKGGQIQIGADIIKEIVAHENREGQAMKREHGWHNDNARSRIEPKLPLTKREEDCIKLMCLGKSNREIAEGLGIGRSTLHTHLRVIYQRLNVKNRVQAVVAYILQENGLTAI